MRAVRSEFETLISKKTGWGKNELLRQLDLAVANVSLRRLEERRKEASNEHD